MTRILIYDLERSPTLAWVYDMYDARVLKVEQKPAIMSISWRWYGEEETHHASLASMPSKGKTGVNEALVKLIWELFDEADIVVAHNANRFDNKVAVAAFLLYNLPPPSPYKTVDTLRVAKGVAKFNYNTLDSLCESFGIGNKSEVKHSDVWYQCLSGSKEAWEQMKVYNNQDVDLLYGLYEKLLPYIKNHPNRGDLEQRDGICPKCGSDHLEKRGFNHRRSGDVQRYLCLNCKGWTNESKLNQRGRLVNA